MSTPGPSTPPPADELSPDETVAAVGGVEYHGPTFVMPIHGGNWNDLSPDNQRRVIEAQRRAFAGS
jgi:hypothetical protein